jgi:hypothetical protein
LVNASLRDYRPQQLRTRPTMSTAADCREEYKIRSAAHSGRVDIRYPYELYQHLIRCGRCGVAHALHGVGGGSERLGDEFDRLEAEAVVVVRQRRVQVVLVCVERVAIQATIMRSLGSTGDIAMTGVVGVAIIGYDRRL